MHATLARHDQILRDVVSVHGGQLVKTTGDGIFAVFRSAAKAVATAVAGQHAIADEPWPDVAQAGCASVSTPVMPRRDDDYSGPSSTRAARLMAAATAAGAGLRRHPGAVRRGAGRLGGVPASRRAPVADVGRPVGVFQVLIASLANEFPMLVGRTARQAICRTSTTSFVGRGEDARAVAGALEQSALLTITGVGGVGKSRLAVEIATELEREHFDGAWLCELAPAADAGEFVQIVATTLRAPVRPGVGLDVSVAEFLRPKRLLLVLDNCEHLIDAASGLARLILRSCPRVRVLATSREALGVEGEQVWPLRPLPLEHDSEATSAAVQLFNDRARSVRPDFRTGGAKREHGRSNLSPS